MTTKPQLGFWQIWNMCFGFLGIQFGFALQNTNVSRVFQTLGASIDDIPLLWIAAPVTGLLVQPIIGYWSDRSWTRLGRRRPFILYGALAASLALIAMPHSPALWIAAGMLWVLDASINITMEPFRALVGDMLPEQQRATGYTLQSFFIGIGAVVASALPWMFSNWLGISNTAAEGVIPDSVIYAFYGGAGAYLLTVLWTVVKTREYSPAQLAAFDKLVEVSRTLAPSVLPLHRFQRNGWMCMAIAMLSTAVIYFLQWDAQLYILAGLVAAFGLLQIIAHHLQKRGHTENACFQITSDLFQMPRTMKQLAAVQFFSWFALFSMWIYSTPAVTAHHYQTTDTTSLAYNNGADWVALLFAAYNGFAALAAIFIPWLVKSVGQQKAHALCLLCGAAGLISFMLIDDPRWLMASMVGVGIAWASILSMPYAMLSCALPAHKMGTYIGIFNFFIVIPQILAASILGLLLREVLQGNTLLVIVTGGVSLMVAAALTLRVDSPVEIQAP